ncbi:MAG: hypothetical protein HY865_22770 [Chloroflexi bacterium]|nr:hypothetical protein [Chloroflexota bacterium]
MSEETVISFLPPIPNRFADFERLFAPSGTCGGCWRAFWKLRGRAVEIARRSALRPIFRYVIGE